MEYEFKITASMWVEDEIQNEVEFETFYFYV